MASYYPDQTTILPMTTIRRERLLPPDVVGEVTVTEDAHVSAVDVVARGVRVSRYLVLDLRKALGVNDPEELEKLLLVRAGQAVKKGQPLAGDRRKKREQVRAPATGLMAQIVDGRAVLQSGLSEVLVRAGFRGMVAAARKNRGIVLETVGGLVQGVWGNGKMHLGALRMAPKGGINVLEADEFSTDRRGALMVSPQPLDRLALFKAEELALGGVIAPCMPANLRGIALKLKIPIMLTEGFGDDLKMNRLAVEVLESYVGIQASLNAQEPNRWLPDRPEVIIPAAFEQTPPPPARAEALRIGAEVRIIRPPYIGVIARVQKLPAVPQRIENGLRLPVAEVMLPSGRAVTVPLVNLELFGRG